MTRCAGDQSIAQINLCSGANCAEHPDDATVSKRDQEQKKKMKKYADK